LGIFSLTLYYTILFSLHTTIKCIALFCHEIISRYNFNNMLETIKMLCSCEDLNSGSLYTTAK
jgi:hypothetical protein